MYRGKNTHPFKTPFLSPATYLRGPLKAPDLSNMFDAFDWVFLMLFLKKKKLISK